jgi:hypothetical protein
MTTLTGLVKGRTIALDEGVPPELDGKRVRLIVEAADETNVAVEDEAVWHDWVERGPQGPIEDNGEPEFP